MEIFVILLISLLIFYSIAEFFGRSKHIGKWWTFGLLSTNLIFGIIALIVSPSAKSESTRGNQNHKVFGYISIVLGVINLFLLNPVSLGLIVLGFYLIELSKGKIKNKNPKFYLDNNSDITESIRQKTNNEQKKENNSFEDTIYYYIIENNIQSEPLTLKELINKKINKDTYVWKKGLEDWVKASEIIELENIVIDEPPPFNPSFEKQNISTNRIFIINDKPYTKENIKNEFENGNYFVDKNTIITLEDNSQNKLMNIPELKFILEYFPPEIKPHNS